jgi:carbon monoxide dehydrogenase subunit G
MQSARSSLFLAVAAAWSIGSPISQASAQATLDDHLSSEDHAKLARGELVTRRTSERRGPFNLIGGTSWQVIAAAPSTVWRALHDLDEFDEMLPGASRARQTFNRGTDRGVRVQHGNGAIDVSYHLRLNYIEASHVVMFRLDDRHPSAFRAGWGFIKVQSYSRGRTLVSFGILADVGDGIIAGALRPKVHRWMLRVPRTMKQYLEGEGRERYAGR